MEETSSEAASAAARALGSIRTPKKTSASQKTLESARQSRWTPEAKERQAEALRAAWARRKAATETKEAAE